jgi:hypothetical protein
MTIRLPDDLAREADTQGMRSPAAREQLIRVEIGRRRYPKLQAMLDQFDALPEDALANDELNAEIAAARATRRT